MEEVNPWGRPRLSPAGLPPSGGPVPVCVKPRSPLRPGFLSFLFSRIVEIDVHPIHSIRFHCILCAAYISCDYFQYQLYVMWLYGLHIYWILDVDYLFYLCIFRIYIDEQTIRCLYIVTHILILIYNIPFNNISLFSKKYRWSLSVMVPIQLILELRILMNWTVCIIK